MVNENDFIDAYNENLISGFALDVFDKSDLDGIILGDYFLYK